MQIYKIAPCFIGIYLIQTPCCHRLFLVIGSYFFSYINLLKYTDLINTNSFSVYIKFTNGVNCTLISGAF